MAGFQIDMSPLERSSRTIGQSLMNIGQTVGNTIQSSNQQEQQQQEQGDAEDLMRRALGGDPEAFKELTVKSPQAARQAAEYIQSQQAGQQGETDKLNAEKLKANKDTVQKLFRIQNLPEVQRDAAYQEVISNPLDDFDETDLPYMNDPKNLTAKAVEYFGADDAKAMFGGNREASLPADTVGFNDLIKDMSPKQQETAKLVKAGLKGRAVTNAELTAIGSGEIKSYSDYKIKQKQAEKFAELSGSSRAKAIDSGIDKISKIDVGISNIDAAIKAVNDGAGTGAIEKMFPSITAASVALDNIQGKMALDVIGAVTFGALSQGELDLARNVALPTGLDGPELTKHLQDKKIAQQKLRNYYNDQIQFLDQGGTVAGFMRQKERGISSSSSAVNEDDQAMQWAQANPDDPRAAQIMQKIKGNQ